jgi:hypothetical protein
MFDIAGSHVCIGWVWRSEVFFLDAEPDFVVSAQCHVELSGFKADKMSKREMRRSKSFLKDRGMTLAEHLMERVRGSFCL